AASVPVVPLAVVPVPMSTPTPAPSGSRSRPITNPTRPRPPLPFARSAPAPVDTTLKTEPPAFASSPDLDLAPQIQIQLDVDDNHEAHPVLRRATRDTDNQMPIDDPRRPTLDERGKPPLGVVSEEAKRASTISDGIPAPIRPSSPTIPPLPATDSRRLGDRQS